jgi:hypothetical protein
MNNSTDNLQVVFVKFETDDGSLRIARHERATLLSPDEEIDDYVRDIVHDYKSNPSVKYLGLADQDEFDAFQKLKV